MFRLLGIGSGSGFGAWRQREEHLSTSHAQ